ncbi:MAG: hypothetical protein RR394_09840, partial [Oscillospiraceae bacterium]
LPAANKAKRHFALDLSFFPLWKLLKTVSLFRKKEKWLLASFHPAKAGCPSPRPWGAPPHKKAAECQKHSAKQGCGIKI